MNHTHCFKEQDWPFSVPILTGAFCTRNILNDGAPIMAIIHDHESEWQFLNGDNFKTEDIALVCLGCIYDRHSFIGEFSDLPKGWVAWRASVNDLWQYEELAKENG